MHETAFDSESRVGCYEDSSVYGGRFLRVYIWLPYMYGFAFNVFCVGLHVLPYPRVGRVDFSPYPLKTSG